MMNPDEIRDRIVEVVKSCPGTSFVELMAEIGPESVGDQDIEMVPNCIVWSGVSENFAEGVRRALDRVEARACTPLVYLYDGSALNLPIAKNPPSGGYKKPHWLPLEFHPK